MSGGTNVKLTFEGLIPPADYATYLSNYDGYDGFNYGDMGLITQAGIDYFGFQNTGFQSALHGDAEAFTAGYHNAFQGYGWIRSSYANETFNLTSGIFAAALYKSDDVNFAPYIEHGHRTGINIQLTETATTIDFANYGKLFKNLVALEISSTAGSSMYDQAVAIDNLKVHWNGPIPGSGAMRHHVHVNHPVLAAISGHASPDHAGVGKFGADGLSNVGNHGELSSLVSSWHYGGGLTSEFSLPQAEHFGT